MDISLLERAVQEFYSKGIASSTRRTYESAVRRFQQFCTSTNLPLTPASESVLCLYASHLATQGLKHQSIKTYLSALCHFYISWGYPDPFIHNRLPHFNYVLKGIHRSEQPSRSGDRRLPILPSTLEVLLDVWSASGTHFEQTMLWAACCLGLFAFMRAGEFTMTPSQPCPLLPEDVAVDSHTQPSYLSIRLRRSKTDPFGNGITLYVGRTYHRVCPVAAVLSYLAARPPIRGPLFIHQDGTPLTRVQLVQQVRQALSSKGWDVSQYQPSNTNHQNTGLLGVRSIYPLYQNPPRTTCRHPTANDGSVNPGLTQ